MACSRSGPDKNPDRANHYRAATPLALVCDATTQVRFPVNEGATINDFGGSRTTEDVGFETSRAHSWTVQEPTHPGLVSAFRGSIYYRRTGTAKISVFFGRLALRLTSNRARRRDWKLRRSVKPTRS